MNSRRPIWLFLKSNEAFVPCSKLNPKIRGPYHSSKKKQKESFFIHIIRNKQQPTTQLLFFNLCILRLTTTTTTTTRTTKRSLKKQRNTESNTLFLFRSRPQHLRLPLPPLFLIFFHLFCTYVFVCL